VQQRSFALQSEYLTQKLVGVAIIRINISWISGTVTGNAAQSTANNDDCCSSAALRGLIQHAPAHACGMKRPGGRSRAAKQETGGRNAK
jgi:hypothetical protein